MEISKTINNWRFWFLAGLIVLGIGWRLMPHVPNFAPLGAIALLSGIAPRGRAAPWVPLVILVVTDSILGFYGSMLWTWLAFVVVTLIGSGLRNRSNLSRMAIGVPLASLSFFAISNFGTWLTSGMYAHNLAGLVNCYAMALPFFRATALSDALFGVTLLGLCAYMTRHWSSAKVTQTKQACA